MSSELMCVFWVVALSNTIDLMRGADLVREARLRAGLTQDELARRSGTPRSVIGRWEQGAVQPGFDNMLAVIEACGFDLPLQLVPRDTALDERLDKNRLLSPERRAQRYLTKLDREVARG
jgi:transcriptional regulator with XRE-family HTH domain